jgi:predicted kinase
MKKIIILRGLPASGKSTYAKNLLSENPGMYKRLNRDEMRLMFDNNHHTDANEKFIAKVRDLMMLEALKAGKHVIIDDTNLSERSVERIRQIVRKHCIDTADEVQVEVKEITTSLEECLLRDEQREKKVGRNVIMRMYKQHVLGNERVPHYKPQDTNLPKAVLCDLDGTLAIIHGRSPFDTACETDLLNEPVANLLAMHRENKHKIIFMSGREEAARASTQTWLAKHNIEFDALCMRATGDARKDAIVKKELFEANVLNQYHVEMVYDDRDQVVDLWRLELGLPCMQVNYGDF